MRKLSSNWEKIALGILILIILVSHALYVFKTYQFPHEDEHVYLQYAVDILPFLKNLTFDSWNQILEVTKYRQPLYPILVAIPLLIFGTGDAYKLALLLNGVFYAITILATYFLAREFVSKKAAFLASYIFTFYGFPLFYLHFTYSETATTMFVALALLFLAKARNFSLQKHTLFFSLSIAFGALTRWVTLIFLVGPFLFSFLLAVREKLILKRKVKSFLINIAILILAGLIPILLLYYLPRISLFMEYIGGNRYYGSQWAAQWTAASLQNPLSPSSLVWYMNIFGQLTVFFWALFIIGLILSLRFFKKYGFLALAFIIPYLIFTLGSTWKGDRFIVPIYPTLAILSVVVVEETRKHLLKLIIIVFILVLGFLNFLGASWGVGPMKFSITGGTWTVPHSVILPMPIGHPRRVWLAPISWPPRKNEGNADLILKTIIESHDKPTKPTVLLTFFIPQIEGPLYTTVLYQQRGLINLKALWGFEANDYDTLFDRIKSADYVLIKEGGAFDDQFDGRPDLLQTFNETVRSSNARLPMAFKKIKEIDIPFDKSQVIIYKNLQGISLLEWNDFTALFLPQGD